MPAKGLCFHSMRTARFGAQRMTDSKRKAQATLGAFFSGNATNTGADAASNKAPRTTAGASSSSSGGKRSEWLKRGEPAVSVMVRTRGIRVGDPLELSSSTRVAAFDFDSTLVETLSGSRFPKNPGDWKVFNQHVKPKLQQLHADGYRCDGCPAPPGRGHQQQQGFVRIRMKGMQRAHNNTKGFRGAVLTAPCAGGSPTPLGNPTLGFVRTPEGRTKRCAEARANPVGIWTGW